MKFYLAVAILVAAVVRPAASHHGWNWTTGDNLELTGKIVDAELGNPHGLLRVDVDGVQWTIEVGQPWRNQRAGLEEGDLAEGVEATFIGEPSAAPNERRLKAERILLNGREHALYPDRM